MAIKRRVLSGGAERFTVSWVLGGGASGTAPTQAETLGSRERAEAFQADVKACGWRWPDGWVKGEGYVKPNETKPAFSFAEVAEDHFALQTVRMRKGLKKPYTHHRDLAAYRLHLLPTFGTKPFKQVMPAHIEAWLQLQQKYGASPKSIRNRHGLLYAIMEHGRGRMGLRQDNPCKVTELPVDRSKKDLLWLEPWEWKLLSACLRDDARRVAEALLQTGARWGEISAVQLAQCQIVAEDDIIITLNQAWSKRAPEDDPIRPALHENKSWKLGRPKSDKGRRVHITGDLAREVIEQDILGKQPGDFLFTTRSGKPWRYPDFEYDRWRQGVHLARECGLYREQVTIHMLRHTAAVWALSRGMTLHEVSHMLGHASIQITWDKYGGYAGDDGRMSRELAEQIKMAQNAIIPGEQMPTREQVYRPVREGRRKVS